VSETPFLAVTDDLYLPRAELTFRASRSGGPGGQHVNTSSTRVELVWNVTASPTLTEPQRARIAERLANRINSEGELLLAESGSRSQAQNKEAVVERLVELLRDALHIPKARRKTRPPRAAHERRLESKKRRSETKRMRGPVERD
jgi:ribosome-associated protein